MRAAETRLHSTSGPRLPRLAESLAGRHTRSSCDPPTPARPCYLSHLAPTAKRTSHKFVTCHLRVQNGETACCGSERRLQAN